MASALATNSRLSAASPARFSSCVSTSVSNDCKREVNAAPRSQIFREPMSRKVGSWERRCGVVDILIPRQAAVDRLPQQVGQRQLDILAPRESLKCRSTSSLKPRRSSSSRTRTNPPSEVTREPWKSTLNELLNES